MHCIAVYFVKWAVIDIARVLLIPAKACFFILYVENLVCSFSYNDLIDFFKCSFAFNFILRFYCDCFPCCVVLPDIECIISTLSREAESE